VGSGQPDLATIDRSEIGASVRAGANRPISERSTASGARAFRVRWDTGAVSAPPVSPSIILLTVARRVESELGAALAPLGLTVSRLGLLGHVRGVPGASFSELARMSGTSVQSVHTTVKALVAAGLVRDSTARAGAASTIELTPEGARLLGEAMTAVSGVDDRLFGPDADPVLRQVGDTVRIAFPTRPSS
jgi:DNA-binding MarR family transcriptional regulator